MKHFKQILFSAILVVLLSNVGWGQTYFLNDDFEDNNITGWTESTSSRWGASATGKITGSYSLKHTFVTATASTDQISYALTGLNLSSATTTFKFKIKHGIAPSGNNNWAVFIISNDDASQMKPTGTADGYIVGVDYTGTDDLVKLWSVTNGTATAVITSTINWETNANLGITGVGSIEVVRSASGGFILKIDSNNDGTFDYTSSETTDATYTTANYFGTYFKYSTTGDQLLWADDIIISQPSSGTPPTVTTQAVSSIGTTTATGNGNITDIGSASVTEHGVCWNTTTNPTTSNSKTTDGAVGTGTFTSSMTGLSVNTYYYVRAYATNTAGTSYGDNVNFWTLANVPSAPTVNGATSTSLNVTINVNSNPTSTEFAIQETGGQYVQSDGTLGGSAVWQTNSTWGTKTVTGLSSNTTYTFQVKARNGANTETAFGSTANAYTLLSAPAATTASLITSSSFTANWNALTGATSYKLDVYTSSTSQLINEGFEGVTFAPTGWITTGWTRSTTSGDYLNGVAAAICGSNTGTLTTSAVANPTSLSFYLGRSSNTTAKTLTIEVSTTSQISGFSTVATYDHSNVPVSSYNQYTVDLSAYSSNSTVYIRFNKTSSTTSPWRLDDVLVTGSSITYVSGYQDKTISVPTISDVVTGLSANTAYYYRVRGVNSNGTSANSNVITALTANTSQTSNVSGIGNQNIAIGNSTGVGFINFTTVTNTGNVSVYRFSNQPTSHGLTGNVSSYRWVIEAGSGLVFTQGDGYTLQFSVADCPGISELAEGNNTSLQLYKRSTPGTGTFSGPIALTYHRNGTDNNQADDYLTSELITSGFSEFVLNSPDQPLPVTLSSFNSTISNRNIKLNWVTETEVNNAGFEVQRSVISNQLSDYNKIGFVEGKGTKNTPTSYSFEDKNLNTGKYKYRLKQVDHNGNFEYFELNGEVEVGVPKKFDLSQNYPNPFNPVTKINFDLPVDSRVSILVYDVAGREVARVVNNEFKKAGYYTSEFKVGNLSSGVYFYVLSAENFRAAKKMVVLR